MRYSFLQFTVRQQILFMVHLRVKTVRGSLLPKLKPDLDIVTEDEYGPLTK